MTLPLISIHMACNNPDNGDFAGRVAQISLDNECLQFTARAWTITSLRRCPKLREDTERGKRVFYFAGKPWQFERRNSWIGNWCWDGYAVTVPVAEAFLAWLRKRDLFQCEGGWCELTEAWDAPGPLVLPVEWWKSCPSA